MYVNNPKIALHALCIFLDSRGDKEVAFVQCPQQFYDGLRDDPFGNQLVALFTYMGGGFAGLQGMVYVGTNCFHRRKVLYGLCPDNDFQNGKKHHGVTNGKLFDMERVFGTSKGFVESTAPVLEGKTLTLYDNLHNSLQAANEVASCGYEDNTSWGKELGWMYGSTSEDLLTGLKIHSRGWRSEFCSPDPIAFKGCSTQDIIGHMIQQKRWGSGLLDVLFSKQCPIFYTLYGKLQFRECLGYLWTLSWALRSIPEICYASLPAYCIITNSRFLPKKLGLWIPATLLVIYQISTLLESLKIGLSIRTWWNNQRSARITTMNAWFFACLAILLKRLRISNTIFEITKKNQPSFDEDANEKSGRFTFNESPVFLPGTTILLVQLIALVTNLLGWQPSAINGHGSGVGEMFCSVYLVVCYWPFLKGLFGKGEHGIPLSILCKPRVYVLIHMTIEIITPILHHRGSLLREEGVLKYVGGEMCVWEGIDIDIVNRFTVEGLCKEHYYPRFDKIYWLKPGRKLEVGLRALEKDAHVVNMCNAARKNKGEINIYFIHPIEQTPTLTKPSTPHVASPLHTPLGSPMTEMSDGSDDYESAEDSAYRPSPCVSDEDDSVVKKKSDKGKGIAVDSSNRMKSPAGRKRKGRECASGSGNAGTSNRAEPEVGPWEEDEVVEQETEEPAHRDEDNIF
ncbi:Cellulose synthase [Sesbania bispinosa]|nr:Cellulose synthase [Sesbania bispinosa]